MVHATPSLWDHPSLIVANITQRIRSKDYSSRNDTHHTLFVVTSRRKSPKLVMPCHLDHPRIPPRRAAFKALFALCVLLVLSDASAAESSSSFDGMLNSYQAYRAYMKGDSGGARRRKLLNDVEATEEERPAASSSRVLPSSPSRSNAGAKGGPSSNNRGRHRREQLKLTTEKSESSTMCSCSPRVFHLRFDFSTNCSDDDIKSNGGIRGTLCLLGEAPDVDVGVPVPDTGVDVSEAPTYLVDDTPAPTIQPSPVIAPSPSAPPVADDITILPTWSPDGNDIIPSPSAPPVADDITILPTWSTSAPPVTAVPIPAGDGSEAPTYAHVGDNIADTYFPTFAPTTVGADPFAPPGAGSAVIDSVLEDGGGDDAPASKRKHHRMKEDMRANSAAIAAVVSPPTPTPHLASSDATPYPTDDETYPPTFVVAEYDGGGQWKFPASWAAAAATTSGGGGGGGGSGRLLTDGGGSSFGRWMSDDQYISIPHDPSDSKDITLSYTSKSAALDPAVPLDDQLDLLPGGVVLILIGQTNNGEIVRNRVMWTYTMGCGKKDVTMKAGEGLGWTIFLLDNFDLDESKASGKTGKSRRRRMERNHQLDRNRKQWSPSQQVKDDRAEEMAYNIFGRRLSRYNEATRIKSTATESGKPQKRRLRTRIV
ncbi:hypothetical protein ACHAW5_001771 [Stephanodiscus triporus]|uniref:Uncharacterized protein n=1 Tax=Stephanodiscus triporus TaxID=2934178 RepID=A0ABD3NR91_9STRA